MSMHIKIDPDDLPRSRSYTIMDAKLRKAGKMRDKRGKRSNNPKRNWKQEYGE